MQGKLFLCIHGHFYQPPRENPWIGEIELQPSAAPFHDWNERIFQECYKPNSEAIIVDDKGDILERVNNYQHLSFNFGPNLLYWIKTKHPDTYCKIIEADRASALMYNGHGNAIAMVYNHLIMPLAKKRDKITQVKWGMKDFENHFGRIPEGIWLAETACDEETLEVLINEGIKYIILDPSQAEKIRPLAGSDWEIVSAGTLNPKFPYRAFSVKSSKKYIDIFFYDGPLSKGIAFDDVIFSSEKLMSRIDSAKIQGNTKNQLLSMAVDGETFGHHKHFADRTIAYLMSKLAKKSGYQITNFGEFLDFNPPGFEVRIKQGLQGLGTSWSCVHGVGRWMDDCGCSTGSQPGWNQKWRKPLRKSLNRLRKRLNRIYKLEEDKYFKNVWNARNDYISIILDPSDENIERFFTSHGKRTLKKSETETCLKLLEMEKYSLFMFTSCAWFFADVSGIETVKILEFSKRAVELAKEFSNKNIEEEFLQGLSQALSNRPEFLNAGEIYKNIS